MNVNDEINSLAGETIALQTLLADICSAMLAFNPDMKPLLARAFDESANHLENVAIKAGKSAGPKRLIAWRHRKASKVKPALDLLHGFGAGRHGGFCLVVQVADCPTTRRRRSR